MANTMQLMDVDALKSAIDSYMKIAYDCPLSEVADFQKSSTNTKLVYAVQGLYEATEIIDDCPTVDAVPVKCKIGEWVYALWEAPVKQKYIIYCAEVKEIRIGMRNCRLTTTYRLEPIMYRGHIHEYRDEDFGRLVFPSENEAEAALAKTDGHLENIEF